MNRKERRTGSKLRGGPAPNGAPTVDQLFAVALLQQQAGDFAKAEALYGQVLASDPEHVDSLHHLGLMLHQLGHSERAADLIGRAIFLSDGDPELHYNLAVISQTLGRLDDAVWHNQRVLALKPDSSEAHNNLGVALFGKGQFQAAAASHRQALALNPDMVEAYFNLGNACFAQGQWDEAANAYRQALARNPDHFGARNNLARALNEQGKQEEAAAQLAQARGLKSDQVRVLGEQAHALLSDGKPDQALAFVRQALAIEESLALRALFTECVKTAQSVPTDPDFRRLIVRAMLERWDHPYLFVRSALALIRQNRFVQESAKRAVDAWPRRLPAAELFGPLGLHGVASDEVLRSLLLIGPNVDPGMERFLTAVRHALLEAATTGTAPDDVVLGFYSALAAQCFLNEYSFGHTDEELARAGTLRDVLIAALESGAPIPPVWLAAVASYFPVGSMGATAAALADRKWPPALNALLVQPMSGPAENEPGRPRT